MKKVFLLLLLLLLPGFTGIAATPVKPVLGPESFGLLSNLPLYIQEWHIWWGFPYPDTQRQFTHMTSSMNAAGEPWRLDWDRNGFPLVGPYDSANPEIIRWQIRCLKACGLTSVAVMIHPDNNAGLVYTQENAPNIVRRIVDIAGEEGFEVFFMDEVAFRRSEVPKDPAIMAKRVSRFLKEYGNAKGFHRIDGKPVFYFQTYGWKVKPEELQRMFAAVEAEVGEVYWMVFGPVEQLGAIPQIKSIVTGSTNHRRDKATRAWLLENQNPVERFAAIHRFGKRASDIQYPKFDNTSQPWRVKGVSHYGLGGRALEKNLRNSLRGKPDFIMFSSWNDWEEGANFEPGWDFDGFTDDPYFYCRVLAHLKGIEFVPPPPPAREAVHPTVWEKLGYGDGAGPLVDRIERSHNRGGSLAITVRDTVSEVTGLEVVWNGDSFFKAPQSADGKPAGNLTLAGNSPAAEILQNTFGFTPGRAIPVGEKALTFELPAGTVPPEFCDIGIATGFRPESPMAKIRVQADNFAAYPVREPVGGMERFTTLNFNSNPRISDFPPELWEGWRTRVVRLPRRLNWSKGLRLTAPGEKLGLISILGAPRPERVVHNGRPVGGDSKIKVFQLDLPDTVLETPGAHFLWLRGCDAAGNWGPPRLYAVPNYEFFERAGNMR